MSQNVVNSYRFVAVGNLEGIAFCGNDTTGERTDTSETYDGVSWTSTSNVPDAIGAFSGSGNANSALCINGSTDDDGHTNDVYVWDGTSWGSDTSTSSATREATGGGNSSGGMRIAGQTSGIAYLNDSEEFNGTTWTSGGTYILNVRNLAGGGITDSAQIAFFGLSGGVTTNKTGTYDGTSFTEENPLPFSTQGVSGDSLPDISEAMTSGSRSGVIFSATWDGTNWTDESSALTVSLNKPLILYVSSTEVYVWGGDSGSGSLDTGLIWDGSSFATATGTLNTARDGSQGGINE